MLDHTTTATHCRPASPTPRRNQLRARDRLNLIKEIIRQNGGVCPTQPDLQAKLRSMGVKTSTGTIVNDLNALGYAHAPSAYKFKSAVVQSACK